jgi:ectoine hydroxylase-related dioxygenase (phytanoyl-CoA dioxygenase family)
MEVVTVWLAIDPSRRENGCMNVIPRTHDNGFSEYEPVDPATNVFASEVRRHQFDEGRAVAIELEPNHASLHDGRIIHGSQPNHSSLRRCGYTMRYISTAVKLSAKAAEYHQIYLARGEDRAGNTYADHTRAYLDKVRYRTAHGKNGH